MILRLAYGALAENRVGGVNLEVKNILQALECHRNPVMKFVRIHHDACITHLIFIGPSVYDVLLTCLYVAHLTLASVQRGCCLFVLDYG